MKIIITSDLHYGVSDFTHEKVTDLVSDINNANPDILVLAGDIAENIHTRNNFDRCLKLFSDIDCIKGLVIGNHDLWSPSSFGLSSDFLWESYHPHTTIKNNFVWLENDDIIMNDIAIVGSIAWYDYSSRSVEMNDEYYRINKYKFNNDGRFIDWEKSDKKFAKSCEENLLNRVRNLHKNPDIEKIIIVTHVPIFGRQMVSMITDNNLGDAYFGNFTIGERVIYASDKISHVVSGHTHREVNTSLYDINIYTLGSDYNKPTFLEIEI